MNDTSQVNHLLTGKTKGSTQCLDRWELTTEKEQRTLDRSPQTAVRAALPGLSDGARSYMPFRRLQELSGRARARVCAGPLCWSGPPNGLHVMLL